MSKGEAKIFGWKFLVTKRALSNIEYECCVYVTCMNNTLPDNNLWLQASPVMIGERQCYVEEKRTTGSRGKSIYIFVLSKAWRLLVECKFVYFEKYYVFVYVFFWIAIITENKSTAVAGALAEDSECVCLSSSLVANRILIEPTCFVRLWKTISFL